MRGTLAPIERRNCLTSVPKNLPGADRKPRLRRFSVPLSPTPMKKLYRTLDHSWRQFGCRLPRAGSRCAQSGPIRNYGAARPQKNGEDGMFTRKACVARQPKSTSAPPGPDASRVQQLAEEVKVALRAARDQARTDTTALQTQRSELSEQRDDLAKMSEVLEARRDELDAKAGGLAKLQDNLGRDREAAEKSNEQIEAELRTIASQRAAIDASNADLAEQQRKYDAACKALAKKEQQVAGGERKLAEQTSALAPKKQELEGLRTELDARTKQLEDQASALGKTRETFAAMQSQLTQDQEAVAQQREELLRRLGETPAGKATPQEPLVPVGPAPKDRAPKPAAAVDQFRKLRRDAKRKSIGV